MSVEEHGYEPEEDAVENKEVMVYYAFAYTPLALACIDTPPSSEYDRLARFDDVVATAGVGP